MPMIGRPIKVPPVASRPSGTRRASGKPTVAPVAALQAFFLTRPDSDPAMHYFPVPLYGDGATRPPVLAPRPGRGRTPPASVVLAARSAHSLTKRARPALSLHQYAAVTAGRAARWRRVAIRRAPGGPVTCQQVGLKTPEAVTSQTSACDEWDINDLKTGPDHRPDPETPCSKPCRNMLTSYGACG